MSGIENVGCVWGRRPRIDSEWYEFENDKKQDLIP